MTGIPSTALSQGASPLIRKRGVSKRKTLSRQVVRGQAGINLIERVILEMGSSWSPTGATEVGIDGYVELFDQNTHHALGKTLAVQSKVLASFSNENDEGFDYYCDERDLAYWLDGNMPVLLVVSRPESGEAYWLSIKDHFSTPERRAAGKAHFSKAYQRFDKDCFSNLFRVGRQPESGLYLGPAPKEERLVSNLLRLEKFPEHLWVAATEYRKPQQIWPILNDGGRRIGGDWVLHDGSILSFQDLRERPWSLVCDQGTCDRFSTTEWAFSSDVDRRRRFVELLNRALKDQVYPQVRYWPDHECFAFAGTLDTAPIRSGYRSLLRQSSMTVVFKYRKRAKDGRVFTWLRHLAFRRQFRLYEDQWFLEITPTYVFTWDGIHTYLFHEESLKKIKRIEGNRAVLSAVALWADFLSSKKDLLEGHVAQTLQFGPLVEVGVPVGIDDAAWSAASGAPEEHSLDLIDDLLMLSPQPEKT